MPFRTRLIIATLLAGLALAETASAASVHLQTLRTNGIEPTATDFRVFLLSHLETLEEKRRRIEELIGQLGSRRFDERERAMSTLMRMYSLPPDLLAKAKQAGDPETRWRLEVIESRSKNNAPVLLHAVFESIRTERVKGLAPELIRIIPMCQKLFADKHHVIRAARLALPATATEADVKLLRTSIAGDNREIRVAATNALGAALEKKATKDIAVLLKDKDERVALAATTVMANWGDRKCIDPLLALLDAEDVNVRVSASMTLQDLTGKYFSYAAYDDKQRRTDAIARWRNWFDNDGAKLPLKFPLRPSEMRVSYLGGNILLAYGYKNKIEERDPTRKNVIWSYSANGVWSAEKMANGNYLLAAYSQNQVMEVTPEKKVVWTYKANCLNAKPLRNGNVLIADYGGSRALEVSKDQKIVWEYRTNGNCCDIQRLPNGNTLCASTTRVVEVTPNKKVVWEWMGKQVYGARRLRNGNTLVTDLTQHKVLELSRNKEVVWELKVQSPCDAFRLPNGNTLVTSSSSFIEVTPDKKILWTMTGLSYGTARR